MERLHFQRLGPRPKRLWGQLVVGTLDKIGVAIIDEDIAPHFQGDQDGVVG